MQGGKLSSGRRNIRNAECQVCHYHHVYEQSNAHGAHGPNYNEEIPNHSQTRIVWDFEQGGSKSTWVEGLLSFCPSLIIQLADSLVRLLPSLSLSSMLQTLVLVHKRLGDTHSWGICSKSMHLDCSSAQGGK